MSVDRSDFRPDKMVAPEYLKWKRSIRNTFRCSSSQREVYHEAHNARQREYNRNVIAKAIQEMEEDDEA